MWDLPGFVQNFQSQVSPELLVHLLAEALEALEKAHHRRGRAHGRLRAEDVRVDREGRIDFVNWGDPDGSDDREARGRDTLALVLAVSGFMPTGARVHPDLRKTLKRLSRANPASELLRPWNARAALCDFLADMRIDDATFSLADFLAYPAYYNRVLVDRLADREYHTIHQLNRQGRKRKAITELHFLLEIAPVNRRALSLWRAVKQGRRQLMARLAYVAAIIAVLVMSSAVVIDKLQLPMAFRETIAPAPKPGPLEIEPIKERPLRGPARVGSGTIVLSETHRPIKPVPGETRGSVLLYLDAEARAYFDGAPGEAPAHRNRDTVWLKAGEHSITIVKPGLPPAMGRVLVRPDRVLELSGYSAD